MTGSQKKMKKEKTSNVKCKALNSNKLILLPDREHKGYCMLHDSAARVIGSITVR